jgi:hypothetical protein
MRGAEVGSDGWLGLGLGAATTGAACAVGVFTATPVTGSGVVAPCIDTSFCLAGSFATAAKCSARPSAAKAFFEGGDTLLVVLHGCVQLLTISFALRQKSASNNSRDISLVLTCGYSLPETD